MQYIGRAKEAVKGRYRFYSAISFENDSKLPYYIYFIFYLFIYFLLFVISLLEKKVDENYFKGLYLAIFFFYDFR